MVPSPTFWNPQILLDPFAFDVFCRDYWEKRECFVSGRLRNYYSTLFSITDVDSLLTLSSLAGSPTAVRLVKSQNGTLVRRDVPYTSEGIPNMYLLYRSYSDEGYTITVDRLELRWKPIAALCKSLEKFFHHPVAANLYLTPAKAKGFLPHFDTHDVFILQLHGSKAWRLYDSPVRLPLAQTASPILEKGFGSPRASMTLEAGDLLYLPRGCVHEAFTCSESSLHLTVGFHVFRWVDLVAEAVVTAAEQDERLRQALPVGFLTTTDGLSVSFRNRLCELLQGLVSTVDFEKAAGRVARRLLSNGQPLPDGHFVSLDKLATLDLASVVVRRSEMLCHIFRDKESVSIHYAGNIIVGPLAFESVFRFIENTKRFVVSDLPNCLADEDKVALARRLVREGLLRMSDRVTKGM
jgi:ribosomal protein L16 Arg81 hydroxylase